jgi:hypothetical protein
MNDEHEQIREMLRRHQERLAWVRATRAELLRDVDLDLVRRVKEDKLKSGMLNADQMEKLEAIDEFDVLDRVATKVTLLDEEEWMLQEMIDSLLDRMNRE